MSVLLNADEGYVATNAAPGSTWTLVFWARIAVDRNDYSTFCSVDAGGTSGGLVLQTDSDGVTPYLWGEPGTVTTASVSALTVGDWHRLAVVRNGTSQTVYRATASGVVTSANQTGQNFTATTLRLGMSPQAGEPLSGHLANVKLYSAVLTQNEIVTEWGDWAAIRTSGLVRHHKFKDAAETTDYSGNGNTLTVVGSPSYSSENPTIDDSTPASATITLVGVGGWDAGATSPTPSYPASIAEHDRLYLIVHSRPSGTAPSGSALTSWTSLYSESGGSGSEGSGTGPTQMSVLTRTAGASPPSGALSGVVVTGGTASQAHIRAYRAASGATWSEQVAYYSKTANTNIGGTTSSSLSLAAGDVVVVTVGQPDDTNTDLAVSSISASGITFGTLTRSPDAVSVSATGNDQAAVTYTATVTAGSATVPVTVAGTGSTGAETTHVQVLRIRASSSGATGGAIVATLGGLTATVVGTRTPLGSSGPMRFGATELVGMALGGTAVVAAYLGGVRVWGLSAEQTQVTANLGGLTATLAGTVSTPSAGSPTGGSGGPLTNRTSVSYNNGTKTSTYHIYASGLDWTKRVGLLVYGDGSGEQGLANVSSTYLMAGASGLIAVAQAHNMVLVTPRAPGNGCTDGDGVCWYLGSNDGTTRAQKTKWLDDLIKTQILPLYNIDQTRVCIAGFSSGAENSVGIYGPAYAASWMVDGLLLAISYGSSPDQYGVTDTYTAGFRANVAVVWDVRGDDETTAVADSLEGYNWYDAEGFATIDRNIIAGGEHDRPGEFGTIVDTYITAHVIPTTG